MPVTPEVQTILDAIAAIETAPTHEQTPEQVREAYTALSGMGTKAEVESVTDRAVPGPRGDIPVRVYRPVDAGHDPLPVLVYLHGGGWVIGDIETHDPTVRRLVSGAGVVAVSVDYRLAPEHPFPAAVDDSLAAIRWVADNAGDLGVDPARLAVAGDSAGGNLAAVACQQLRDSGPPVAFQLLIYPVTDATMSHPSIDENAEGYFLTKESMIWFCEHYLGDGDRTDPRVSPLHADEEALAGLPPALVITAEFDPLRDEGQAYAARLEAAGVPATASRYDSVIHGFFSMSDMIPEGKAAIDEACEALRSALF
jgi:acetyl esterase